MGAAVVLGCDLDVLVRPATITVLVLDADVGKVHVAIEVGEVVLARPGPDFANVVIRTAVAVLPATVAPLPELLAFVELPPEYVATRWPRQRAAVLPRIPGDTELCIVGAGIGALPVCVDVATQRSIPALDAGHALNMMNDRVDKSNGARLFSLWKTP